jgi:surface polysaccharide O-acyltransferase-like enzyme
MIWLDNARIVAVLAVVVLHVAAEIVNGSDMGSGDWWIGNLCHSSLV